jgi:hypothetical protein
MNILLQTITILTLLLITIRNTNATINPYDISERFSTSTIQAFNHCVETHKDCRTKQIPVWETIDAVANNSVPNQETDLGPVIELATVFNTTVIAHGLAKKLIRHLGANCSVETFLRHIAPLSEKAQTVLRKEFFLMTGNPLIMTHTDEQGVIHTLTFLYEELFYKRQYLIDNAKLIFNNRFLSSLDGFIAPCIYYVDKADLSHNFLATLPESLATVPTINLLDLSYNQLATVPAVISKLPALEMLYLHHNQLTTLTPLLGNLKQLYRLDVSHNQLQTLPSNLHECTNLHWLNCAHNAIKQLPESIAAIKNLERIDLSDNQLVELPVQLANLPTLRSINIKNNPSLRTIPAAFKHTARLEKDDYVVFDDV